MVSISNKTIVALLSVALIIAVVSTGLSIIKFYSPLKYSQITGAATNTTTGIATLTVASATAVTMRVNSIAYGSGYVDTTDSACTYCATDTGLGHYAGNATCCTNFNNVTTGFLLENTGNENVTLNFTCAETCTAATFVNGTSPLFQFRVVNSSNGGNPLTSRVSNNTADSVTDTSGSCDSGDGGWNYSSWTNMAAGGFDLCGSNGSTEYYFGSSSTKDAMIVDIKLQIPNDAITGSQKRANLTFSAQSAG